MSTHYSGLTIQSVTSQEMLSLFVKKKYIFKKLDSCFFRFIQKDIKRGGEKHSKSVYEHCFNPLFIHSLS